MVGASPGGWVGEEVLLVGGEGCRLVWEWETFGRWLLVPATRVSLDLEALTASSELAPSRELEEITIPKGCLWRPDTGCPETVFPG